MARGFHGAGQRMDRRCASDLEWLHLDRPGNKRVHARLQAPIQTATLYHAVLFLPNISSIGCQCKQSSR